MSTSADIRHWLAATKGVDPPAGLSVNEAMVQARKLLNVLLSDEGGSLETPRDLDVMFAMWRCLEADRAGIKDVERVYEFVAREDWEHDGFDERHQLLASLSFLAWSASRRRFAFAEMEKWEIRCVTNVRAQELSRDFLALPFESRSARVNDRFLGDRTILLAAVDSLHHLRNYQPLLALSEGSALYGWVSARLHSDSSDEELWHIGGDISISVAGACRQLGRYKQSDGWLQRARSHFARCTNAEPFVARVEFGRLACQHDLNRPDEVVAALPAVASVFAKYDLAEDQLKCLFMEAQALKTLGRHVQALELFRRTYESADAMHEPLFTGLALIALGEVTAQLGDSERGFELLQAAIPHISISKSPIGFANLHAVAAEILKNEGDLVRSAVEYRKAVDIYDGAGMAAKAAYIRLLRSDALLADGREDEAIAELINALLVIEQEGSALEEFAAVALLQESLRRRKVDPKVSSQLRNWLLSTRELR